MIDAVVRVSAGEPTSGHPPFFRTKLDMVRTCLESFKGAGEARIHILADNCPDEFLKPLERYGTIHRGKWGKKMSLFTAYDFARQHCKEGVLFLEDDYLWRPYTLKEFEVGLMHFGLVSPYDHPGHYGEVAHELYPCDYTTWRWCRTNTHTFAVRCDLFEKYYDDFFYGMHDWQMFTKLAIDGVRVYSPLYSMATHLVKGLLAYNVNWEDIANYYQKKLKIL